MTILDTLRGKGSKPVKSNPPALATLDRVDLSKFREQRKITADQARLLVMLQVCYNSFLAELQAKYKVPGDLSINTQNGEIYKAKKEQKNV